MLNSNTGPCIPNRCKNGGSCMRDTRKENGFTCVCVNDFEGEFCEMEKDVYLSCSEAKRRNSSLQDGVYRIRVNTNSGYIRMYCHMSRLKGCEGSGWTMVMKIDGTKTTFDYNSQLWLNMKSYNAEGGVTGFDYNETKLPTFWSTPAKRICLGMSSGNTTKFQSFSLYYGGNLFHPLYDFFVDETFRNVHLNLQKWRDLIVNSSIKEKCSRGGFNVKADKRPAPYAKVRLGVIGNDENHLVTPTSWLGFGGQWDWSPPCIRHNRTSPNPIGLPVCGNVDKCNNNINNDRIIPAMGYILVR
ncbi:uncharacterized protein LOC114531971 [Dendronephthya gigantea]|uniref:uncharacterized protein LOC114531971 n=1 Tax=Dendronephthya gigantea TaxID=151771 RepID=UPI00106A1459|nr:uncharacterized protein LOC114531971 [Dendronephthya gigantea]